MNDPVIIGKATLYRGDCLDVMRTMPDNSVDSIVTDPPYGIRFMGKAWDGTDIEKRNTYRGNFESHDPGAGPNGAHKLIAAEAGKYELTPKAMRAFQEFSRAWAVEALRVLKPGGHLLSFSSARTYHRMVCGIEDAGFEIRDQIMWVFGSGFPKSLDVSKAIDRMSGAEREVDGRYQPPGMDKPWNLQNAKDERTVPLSALTRNNLDITAPTTDAAKQWDGWGTALKPAHEPICVARKPFPSTVAANVLQHGTGAINIDGCRVAINQGADASQLRTMQRNQREGGDGWGMSTVSGDMPQVVRPDGRWPANLIHDGSEEVLAIFPDSNGQQGAVTGNEPSSKTNAVYGEFNGRPATTPRNDAGSAARFFYCAKASREDRNEGLEGLVTDDGRKTPADNAYQRGKTLRQNHHPTVKPTDLMRYLCRLVTPPGGVVLDPFLGSGSTGKAAILEGFRFIGIEQDEDENGNSLGYIDIAAGRIEHAIQALAENTAQHELFA